MRQNSGKTPQPLAHSKNPSALGAMLQALPKETPLSEIELAGVRARLEGTLRQAAATNARPAYRRFGFLGAHVSLNVRLAVGVLLLLLGASAGAAGTFVVMRLVVGETHVLPGPSRAVVGPSPRSHVQGPLKSVSNTVAAVPVEQVAINIPEITSPAPARTPKVRPLLKNVSPPEEAAVIPTPIQDDPTGEQVRLVGEALAALARPQEQAEALSKLKSYVALYPHGVFLQEAKVAIVTALTRSDRQDEALQVLENAPEITANHVDLSLLHAELLIGTNCDRSINIFESKRQLKLSPAQSERADFGYARALQACGREADLRNALQDYRTRHPDGSRIATVTRWLEAKEPRSSK
jgi:hypothetical protein